MHAREFVLAASLVSIYVFLVYSSVDIARAYSNPSELLNYYDAKEFFASKVTAIVKVHKRPDIALRFVLMCELIVY
jgi:hypothetical protein